MYKHIDHLIVLIYSNEIYKTVMKKLNDFIEYTPSSKDNELLLKKINELP